MFINKGTVSFLMVFFLKQLLLRGKNHLQLSSSELAPARIDEIANHTFPEAIVH